MAQIQIWNEMPKHERYSSFDIHKHNIREEPILFLIQFAYSSVLLFNRSVCMHALFVTQPCTTDLEKRQKKATLLFLLSTIPAYFSVQTIQTHKNNVTIS